MPYVMIHHKVADFAKWKPVFDEHGAARKAAGSKGGYLFQSADDPNDVIGLLEWDSIENARAFAASDDLREAMQRAGVVSEPTIVFMDASDRPAQ